MNGFFELLLQDRSSRLFSILCYTSFERLLDADTRFTNQAVIFTQKLQIITT